MIEIINIIIFVFFIFFLFSFRKKNVFFNDLLLKNTSHEFLAINFLIILNIIWLFSILDLNKNLLLILILTTLIFNIFKNFDFNIINILDNDYDIIFLFLISASFSVLIAHDLFFSHDVRLFWFEKTLLFYNDLFITEDKTIKPEYPHYGTYLWAFFWKISLLNLEYFGRIFYFIIYVISIFYIFNKINFSKIYFKYLLFLLIILLTFKLKWFDGRQDILVFSFNTFIFGYLYELISNKSQKNIHIFGLIFSLNLLLWSKNDSLLYVAVYFLTILFYVKKNQKIKLLTGIIFIILLKIVFNIIYDISLNPKTDSFEINFIEYILELDLVYRFNQIIIWYVVGLLRNPILLLSLIILVFFYKEHDLFKKYSYFFFSFTLISIGIILVYLVAKYDFPFHMIGSVGRVFLQFSMVFFIPIIKFCEKKKLL